MKTRDEPGLSAELDLLRREKLALLYRCQAAMLEGMRLTDENVRLAAEVHRLRAIVDFLTERGIRGG